MSNADPFYIQLKTHRETQKISLEEISKRTKINIKFLKSIENGEFQILPKTYVRLFLKSYSIEIGINPIKTIEDYDLFTFGAIKPKSDKNLIKNKTSLDTNELKLNYKPKNIIFAILSLLFIYIFFSFVSSLNNTIQTKNNSYSDSSIKSNIDTLYNPLLIADSIIVKNFSEKNFNKSNLNEIDNIKLPIKSPFFFKAKANRNTRIHYRIEKNNITIKDENLIIPKDTTIVLEYSETIFFDIINCNDLEFSINNIQIDNRINCNKSLLRASVDSLGALNASFYSK